MARIEDLFQSDGTEKPETTPPVVGGGLKTLKVPARGEAPPGHEAPNFLPSLVETLAHPSPGTPVTLPLAPAPPPIVQHPDPTLDELLGGTFTYLSGPAGTGKTFLARSILSEREGAVLCATTGIAAVNMGDATTINALLGYYDTASLLTNFASGFLSSRLRKLRKSGIRTLVLDEVSMLDCDQLTALCQAFDDVNLKKSYDASLEETQIVSEEELEMRLLLVGDFAQLPPVNADFAFNSPEWHRFKDRIFTLKNIRRQGDRVFIEALQAVRKGLGVQAQDVFAPCFAPTIDFNFPGTTIVAKNEEVDRINAVRHARLVGELITWKTVRSGEQQKDWLRLIPESVDVKVGALVMVLANLSLGWDEEHMPLGYSYVNGDLGVVEGKDDNGIQVKLQRTSTTVTVKPLTSEWKEPTGKKNPAYEIKGAVTRMPLRLAYASTVHKSQGLSLDQVQVSISNWMFGKGGMMYVALSRCRSLEGLRIVGNPKMFVNKCTVDKRVQAWL